MKKNGRRHAHAVWSRIDVRQMKAINLPFYQSRLTELSKDLFLQHGWRLPDGLRDRTNRNPTNFNLAEWQQAKRAGKDARAIKRVFQEAWQISDSATAFVNALEEKGYYLAQGDRRGYVAVDVQGEIYAVPKWAGVKTKQVRDKLGPSTNLRSVEEARTVIAQSMQAPIAAWEAELKIRQLELLKEQVANKAQLKDKQRAERERLDQKQAERRLSEAKKRQARFRRGLSGLWDRLRGEHKRIQRENEHDAWQAHQQDQRQKDEVVFRHLEERQRLKRENARNQAKLKEELRELHMDRERFEELRKPQDHRQTTQIDLQK